MSSCPRRCEMWRLKILVLIPQKTAIDIASQFFLKRLYQGSMTARMASKVYLMTLPISTAKRGHRGKSKGLLGFNEPAAPSMTSSDSTERVLAEVKGLKDNFEQHYAAIESRVKKSIEGPVKTFTMDDGMPIVMQLSVWDTKLGPATAMLVGDADLMVFIPGDELDASTRMMDVLATGDTCDMSKDMGRLMVKFSIADTAVRGGETWLLVAVYLDLAMDVPRSTIRELLAQTAACWHDDASLAFEALG